MVEPPQRPVLGKPFPPTQHVEFHIYVKDNKCQYVFCLWSLLVVKAIFKEVVVFLSMVKVYKWWHWCSIWTLEYEIAQIGFSNNSTSYEIIYEFGYCVGHIAFDWSTRFQFIHRTIRSQRSWPLSWPYKSSTIMHLHAWRLYTSYAIKSFVHFIELGPKVRNNRLAPRWTCQMHVTIWRAKALHT